MSVHLPAARQCHIRWILLIDELPVIDFDGMRALSSILAKFKLTEAEFGLRGAFGAVWIVRWRCWWRKIWRKWTGSRVGEHYGLLSARFMTVISAVMVIRCRWITTLDKLVVSDPIIVAVGGHVGHIVVVFSCRSYRAVAVLSCLIEFQLHNSHS